MSEEVILDITTIEETVTIDTTDPEVIEIKVVAVTGASEWNQLEGTADKVPFTTTNGGPTALGELAWLASTESLALRLKNGENLDLGEETIYHAQNDSGSAIAKGAAVSYAGTVGASGKLRVKPWNGSTDLPEAFMGLAMGAIATGHTGYVTAFGVIRGVNTSEFSDGVILYANPAGTGLTATKPTGTHVVAAVCINAGNNGTILVRPTIGGYVETTDPRLSDARTPLAHTHGNISNGGAIGTISGRVVVTGTSGILTTQSRSGIDTRTSFPNDDVAAATADNMFNTIVKRNSDGESYFSLVETGMLNVTNTYYPSNALYSYLGLSAATHRTALGLTSLATTTAGTGVTTALAVNVGSSGAFVVNGGALGTPSSGTLTNATGLPISTGVAGLGSGVATFLATPTSANLAAAVTDETGSGSLVFGTSPTLVTPNIGAATGTTLAIGGALPTQTVLNCASTGSSASVWRGRVVAGGDVAKFLMGERNSQAWLGAHNAALNAWHDFYLNPDGGQSVFIGDSGATLSPVPIVRVSNSTGNVGIGTGESAINASSILELSSTTRGFLPPRMTTTQRNAITSVPAGLMIYNTSTNKLNFYNGTAWEAVTSA